MFSPSLNEGGPATATRSRRRQRPLSSDSISLQPKAKRQRVPLSEQTFVNPDAAPEMSEAKADRVAKLPVKHDNKVSGGNASAASHPLTPKSDLSVRSKKPKPGERISKGDGSVILTTNSAYTVSKLPALPDRIRADFTSRQHGALYSSTGHALSLTHTHAFVWPYTVNTASPETFVFNLDYPSRHPSDPLPLGSLVSPSASSDEPGLIVVMPVSGKISYWESISSAATLTFMRQQRSGIEDSVPGMFSGEHVVQIVNAEPAGFILAFSSGRLAHLSVRDGHGRPGISVQFLRSGLAQSGGGFLGSIRNVLKHSALKGDIAAVRAGPPTKTGERSIVAATSKGKVTVWKVHRGGHHDVLVEVDTHSAIARQLRDHDATTDGAVGSEVFEVLDVSFAPKGFEQRYAEMSQLSRVSVREEEGQHHMLLLVTYGDKFDASFAIVEAVIKQSEAQIGLFRPITCYSSPVSKLAPVKPRLYLPNPGLVAFIVFDRAVVIASLAMPPESPEAQLQDSSNSLPAAFEDVIDLRDQDDLEITGSGLEEPLAGIQEPEGLRTHRHKTKNPAALLMVRGVGVVRVATTDIDRFGSELAPKITAKSKLEQAVFFGIKDDNPLAFGRRELNFSNREIGEAALRLSHEILSSESPYLLHVPALLEGNLRARSSYLDRLMFHLNSLKVDLDRETRWALLWNAERMNVAAQIWKQHEQFLSDRASDDKKSIVSEIVEFIHEDEKKVPNPAKGELDRVRHWFTHDVWRLELFVAWAYEVIKHMYKTQVMDDIGITRLLYEAMQVNYEALKGAFDYRRRKLPLYGLQDEKLELGVLVTGYEGLPQPWTSTYYITNNAKRLMELAHQWLHNYYPPRADGAPSAPDPGLIESIRERLPSLTDKYLTTLLEHSRWAATRSDSKTIKYGQTCRQTYATDRYAKVVQLKDYGLWNEAIEVAENHDSITALAEVMVEEVKTLRRDALSRENAPSRSAELRERARMKQNEIAESFDRYGDGFAFAVYEILLREEGVKAVLDFPGNKKGYATKFLRTKPELSKISWINDVDQEKDISHAAETLIELGLKREQRLWNKKIELSLGKLALLAGSPAVPTGKPARNQLVIGPDDVSAAKQAAGVQQIDRELAVIKIQDKLFDLILPTVSVAVDEAAELELAIEYHSGNIPKKHKALLRVFEDGMSRLLRHEALDPLTLIDLLTLVSVKIDPTVPGFDVLDDLFFSALRVSQLSLRGEEAHHANRLIWRRCYIRDNWALINNTQFKDDNAMGEAVGRTAAYLTMYACNAYKYQEKQSFSPLIRPSEALGVYTETLDSRFECMEDTLRQKLLDAMKSEDSELAKYIDKCRMDHWHQATLSVVHQELQADLDQATREGAGAPTTATNGNGGKSLLNGNAAGNGNGNGNANSVTASFVNGMSNLMD